MAFEQIFNEKKIVSATWRQILREFPSLKDDLKTMFIDNKCMFNSIREIEEYKTFLESQEVIKNIIEKAQDNIRKRKRDKDSHRRWDEETDNEKLFTMVFKQYYTLQAIAKDPHFSSFHNAYDVVRNHFCKFFGFKRIHDFFEEFHIPKSKGKIQDEEWSQLIEAMSRNLQS